jgi:hypothetical protein
MACKNFLHFTNEQLQQSEESLTDSQAVDMSKAQREDVFDRVTSCVLQALAYSFEFIKTWDQAD